MYRVPRKLTIIISILTCKLSLSFVTYQHEAQDGYLYSAKFDQRTFLGCLSFNAFFLWFNRHFRRNVLLKIARFYYNKLVKSNFRSKDQILGRSEDLKTFSGASMRSFRNLRLRSFLIECSLIYFVFVKVGCLCIIKYFELHNFY